MVYIMKRIIDGAKAYGTNIACKCQSNAGISPREVCNNQESITKAAIRFNVNQKRIIKCRKRKDTKDLAMGLKKIKSTVLSEAEEEAIVVFLKDDRITPG